MSASREQSANPKPQESIRTGEETQGRERPRITSPGRGRRKAERKNMVITLDKRKRPLGHCTEKRARKLLEAGRAVVYRYYPFTIIIKDKNSRDIGQETSYRIKIDPGSNDTGMAVVDQLTDRVILYLQIKHRASQIVEDIRTRYNARHNRRSRETWYRHPKFRNGGYQTPRGKGWLPPSVKSIGDNTLHWVKKLKKLLNITDCSFEAVRFDTQLMDSPDIEGREYQQGTLFGYEIREYLLDKYAHTCQYCNGRSGDKILEWEHILPKSRGGSDKVKNATLSCTRCNRDKGSRTPEEWEISIQQKKHTTELDKARLEGIGNVINHKVSGRSDRYCAWVSATRRYIEKGLFSMFRTVECSSGGRTKYNRERLGFPKDHHYDALCVGTVPDNGYRDVTNGYCLYIKANGRGTRFRGKINKCGIITVKLKPRSRRIFGFMNGDMVSADVHKGKYEGHHTGRVMTRANGSFDIRTSHGELVTASHKDCRILQYVDGYSYRMAIPLGN